MFFLEPDNEAGDEAGNGDLLFLFTPEFLATPSLTAVPGITLRPDLLYRDSVELGFLTKTIVICKFNLFNSH